MINRTHLILFFFLLSFYSKFSFSATLAEAMAICASWPTSSNCSVSMSGGLQPEPSVICNYNGTKRCGNGAFYETTFICPTNMVATGNGFYSCSDPVCSPSEVIVNGACATVTTNCPSGSTLTTIPSYPSGTQTICLLDANTTPCVTYANPDTTVLNLPVLNCSSSGSFCLSYDATHGGNGLPSAEASCSPSNLAAGEVYSAQTAIKLVESKLAAERLLATKKTSDISTGVTSPTVPIGTVGTSDGANGNGSASPTISSTSTGGSQTNGLGIGDGSNVDGDPNNPDCDGCPTSFSPGSQVFDEYAKTEAEGGKAGGSAIGATVGTVGSQLASTLSPVFTGTCVSRSWGYVIAGHSLSFSNSAFCSIYSDYVKKTIVFLFAGFFVINSFFYVQSVLSAAAMMGN